MSNAETNRDSRPVALVTGVGRRDGIGFTLAERLALDGFDVATDYWASYDRRMRWGADEVISSEVKNRLSAIGVRSLS